MKKQETVMINKLTEKLPIIYLQGLKAYEQHDEENPQLKSIMSELYNDVCPWSLKELLDETIPELISLYMDRK